MCTKNMLLLTILALPCAPLCATSKLKLAAQTAQQMTVQAFRSRGQHIKNIWNRAENDQQKIDKAASKAALLSDVACAGLLGLGGRFIWCRRSKQLFGTRVHGYVAVGSVLTWLGSWYYSSVSRRMQEAYAKAQEDALADRLEKAKKAEAEEQERKAELIRQSNDPVIRAATWHMIAQDINSKKSGAENLQEDQRLFKEYRLYVTGDNRQELGNHTQAAAKVFQKLPLRQLRPNGAPDNSAQEKLSHFERVRRFEQLVNEYDNVPTGVDKNTYQVAVRARWQPFINEQYPSLDAHYKAMMKLKTSRLCNVAWQQEQDKAAQETKTQAADKPAAQAAAQPALQATVDDLMLIMRIQALLDEVQKEVANSWKPAVATLIAWGTKEANRKKWKDLVRDESKLRKLLTLVEGRCPEAVALRDNVQKLLNQYRHLIPQDLLNQALQDEPELQDIIRRSGIRL